ncbi:MAG: hypothetical protein DRP82_00270 [Planctomycetota bacterium]|nr:MAG: hypothetical protein DRP82_00270 [Planctomycetota bacterium]
MMSVNIWYPSIVIGGVCFVMTVVGVRVGDKVGASIGRYADICGGLVLCSIGIKILVEHLW